MSKQAIFVTSGGIAFFFSFVISALNFSVIYYLTDVGIDFAMRNARIKQKLSKINSRDGENFCHDFLLEENKNELLFKNTLLEYGSNIDCYIDENGNDIKSLKKSVGVILSSIHNENRRHKLI